MKNEYRFDPRQIYKGLCAWLRRLADDFGPGSTALFELAPTQRSIVLMKALCDAIGPGRIKAYITNGSDGKGLALKTLASGLNLPVRMIDPFSIVDMIAGYANKTYASSNEELSDAVDYTMLTARAKLTILAAEASRDTGNRCFVCRCYTAEDIYLGSAALPEDGDLAPLACFIEPEIKQIYQCLIDDGLRAPDGIADPTRDLPLARAGARAIIRDAELDNASRKCIIEAIIRHHAAYRHKMAWRGPCPLPCFRFHTD